MISLTLRTVLVLTGCVFLSACGSDAGETLSIEVQRGEFVLSVVAKGELVAAKEIPINAPMGNRGSLTLAWLEEENKYVRTGDVVARFDSSEHELQKERAELELTKSLISQKMTERDLAQKQFVLRQQEREVDKELSMAEKFSFENLSMYSRLEVIDQLLDKEYLAARQYFLDWQASRQQQQGQAQLHLLELEAKNHRDTIDLSNSALGNLEVYAPNDGVLVYEKNWRNEKVRVGEQMWPGSKLAFIPVLDHLQAKLYVFENEAAGIDVGQQAEIRLDAWPERIFRGKVRARASIAAPRNAQNPTKFFEVSIELETTDAEFMRPGQKVEGVIYVARKNNVLSVPNQAVFKKEGENQLYLKRGDQFIRQNVTIGLRSLTRTEIVDGIGDGDRIALFEPEKEALQ
ncbi:MAG: efflux RND transporter periplasmic adaptor subunit [Exilibacterium sp.]